MEEGRVGARSGLKGNEERNAFRPKLSGETGGARFNAPRVTFSLCPTRNLPFLARRGVML